MKRLLRRTFRVFICLLTLCSLFIAFLLNPQVSYARVRHYGNISVYSKQVCPEKFNSVLDKATALVQQSELYTASFHFDVFLNDGSFFPAIPKHLLGNAFAWGYYNNVVLNGENDSALKYIRYNGSERLLARTIAHEMIHCLEASHFGLFHSKPLKNIPNWKWEGYPEYISYRSSLFNEDSLLIANLFVLDSLKNEKRNLAEVNTDEGKSITGFDYFCWWLMIKYCMDIKKMSFIQIMSDDIKYDTVYNEMMEWYKTHHSISPPSGP